MDEFTNSGFFVLRTPLLPFSDFLKLSSSLIDSDTSRAANRAQLLRWIERPEVQEALWLASPDLVDSISRWRDAPDNAKRRKLDLALYRYFARMTARATPFGAFASCSVGEIGGRTGLELGSPSASQRRTRLDMEYLFNLVEAIVRDRALRRHLRFRPNDTLHLVAGQYHHLLGERSEDGRIFKLVATAPLPELAATLERAQAGATTHELVSSLVEGHPGVTLAEAEEFIEQLIGSQVLVSDLTPPVTGAEPAAHVLKELEQSRLPRLAAALRVLDSGLRSLDARGLGVPPAAYDKLVQSAEQLPAEFHPGRLVQVDVIRPTVSALLDERLTQQILVAVQLLNSICDHSEIASLRQFKDEFAERYQEREVPLLEALDDEAGIGFEAADNPTAEPLIQAALELRLALPGALLFRLERLAGERDPMQGRPATRRLVAQGRQGRGGERLQTRGLGLRAGALGDFEEVGVEPAARSANAASCSRQAMRRPAPPGGGLAGSSR